MALLLNDFIFHKFGPGAVRGHSFFVPEDAKNAGLSEKIQEARRLFHRAAAAHRDDFRFGV